MTITNRPIARIEELLAITDLVNQFPADNLHVADLPYRLSSWAMGNPTNTQIWINEAGTVIGWAIMQTPFWTIDYAFHPEHPQLHPQILAWVDERAKTIVDTDSGRPCWFINVFTTQTDRMADLEATGFASQADVGDNSWTKVLFNCQSENVPDAAKLPDGFTIRPLAGESEVQAYVDLHQAVFQSKSMTTEWRQHTLQQPAYNANVDLVAVAPDGTLAAFCIGWINQNAAGQTTGQIEPLGVLEDFRKLGLGRTILTAGMRQLAANGARSICVETDNYRNEAYALYESVGFRVAHDVLVYRKDYGEL